MNQPMTHFALVALLIVGLIGCAADAPLPPRPSLCDQYFSPNRHNRGAGRTERR